MKTITTQTSASSSHLTQQLFRLALLLALPFSIWCGAQEPTASAASEKAAKAQKNMQIVPLVAVSPGQTTTLLLSTWCTVGATRGGGFFVDEMKDGKRMSTERHKSYSRAGVTITVPNFQEAEAFAKSPAYAAMSSLQVSPFQVTITAAADAKPGAMEMHLVDATCSGHCKSDFRVVVLAAEK